MSSLDGAHRRRGLRGNVAAVASFLWHGAPGAQVNGRVGESGPEIPTARIRRSAGTTKTAPGFGVTKADFPWSAFLVSGKRKRTKADNFFSLREMAQISGNAALGLAVFGECSGALVVCELQLCGALRASDMHLW